MHIATRPARSAALHAFLVASGFTVVFTWLFAEPILHHRFLSESDLYEYYLPIFLSPITKWSSFEFSGLPAFADPGDFVWYPPHFLFARIIGSWTGLVVSAFVMAASFTYAYVYRVTSSRSAAAFAGLAYGLSEAMVERLPHLGTLHCFAWLPLIALAIDELGHARWRRWMAIGGIGVACAFLAGHPQPAIYTVYVTALYALTKVIAERRDRRFVRSVAGLYVIGGLLACIKAIPLVEASWYMARQEVNLGQFTGHANTAAQMLSMLFPTILHEGREAPTYVGLITLVLAFAGGSLFRRSWRIAFWTVVALVALLIGAGPVTPVPDILYAVVPLYQKFRVGARHLFLAAFGAAFLAGCAIAALQRAEISARRVRLAALALLVLIIAAALLQAAAPGAFTYEVRRDLPLTLPVWNTGIWVQLMLAALTTGVAFAFRTERAARMTAIAMAILLADSLYSYPYSVTMTGLVPVTIPADAAAPSVHAQQIAAELAPLHQRALAIGGTHRDDVLPAAFARLWRIPIAGGYGPFLLQRYSDLATMGTNGSVRASAIGPNDVALDMLAVRDILVRADDLGEPSTFERDGLRWATNELGMPIGRPDCGHDYPRSTFIPLPPDVTVTAIAVVTHLRCAEDLPQDAVVLRLGVTAANGSTHERVFRAGQDTAETGLSDPPTAQRARHQAPASRFDDPASGRALRFLTRVDLPQPVRGGRIDFDAPGTHGWMTIDRLTLVDDKGLSHPQVPPRMWLSDTSRWKEVRRFSTSRITDRGTDQTVDGETAYLLLQNLRALPRAWIAEEATPVSDRDAIEAVRWSQLPGGRPFDPRITAMVSPDEGGAPGDFHPGSAPTATVDRVDDGRLVVSVSTAGGGFLVVSEQDYPGWRARIDGGSPMPVRRTNVAFMGVPVPPGRHTVEFELVSITERAGIGLTLAGLVIAGVCIARG